MKNVSFLFAILCLVWLSSCMTVDRIQRNCDKFAQICVTNSSNEIQYRDTIIRLAPLKARLPESNIIISSTLKVVSGRVNMPKVIEKNGLITTEVSIIDNQLFIRSFLNDSTILVKPEPIVIHGTIRDEKTTKYITLAPERYIPGIFKITFWIVVIQVVAVIILILISKSSALALGSKFIGMLRKK